MRLGRSRICRGLVACAEVAYFPGREEGRGCVPVGRKLLEMNWIDWFVVEVRLLFTCCVVLLL